jgi:hypothetical protein
MPTPPAVNCAAAMPRGWWLVRELVGNLVGLYVARRGQCRLPPKVARALHRAWFPSADVGGRPRGGGANPSAAGQGGAEAGGEWQQRFANGGEQLNQLLDVLSSSRSPLVIHGLPGVGKTSLALHFAVSSASHFPGGSWWLEASEGFEPQPGHRWIEGQIVASRLLKDSSGGR